MLFFQASKYPALHRPMKWSGYALFQQVVHNILVQVGSNLMKGQTMYSADYGSCEFSHSRQYLVIVNGHFDLVVKLVWYLRNLSNQECMACQLSFLNKYSVSSVRPDNHFFLSFLFFHWNLQTAKTKVINSCLNPVWNEEITFSMKEPVGVIKFVRFHYIYMMNLCSCQKTVLDLHFEIFTYSFLGDLFRVLFLYEMTCFASEEISLLNALTKKFGHTICPRCTQYWFLAPSLLYFCSIIIPQTLHPPYIDWIST